MRLISRRRVQTVRLAEAGRRSREDVVALEEPLEIRVNGARFSVTMRTPGDDFSLVAGFLVSEGIVSSRDELPDMRTVAGLGLAGEPTFNIVDATVTGHGVVHVAERARTIFTTSACGVCGLASIDAVRTASAFPILPVGLTVSEALIASLPDRLRTGQELFDATGGVHAAGLFDPSGDPIVIREDVGRHNAVDKVVGHALTEGLLPLTRSVLQVSGRASFELVQKARMAGVPVLAAVSAPSSLAVELAEDAGITLVGFSRGHSFTIYAHPERIVA